jgi:hypothetical protein
MTAPIPESAPPQSRRLRWPLWQFGSGPLVGRAAARALALLTLIAWLSLASQVRVLIGSRGLLPVADFMTMVRGEGGLTLLDIPTLFWFADSDAALIAGVVAGAALSLLALWDVHRRLCFALSTALYLSYATVARDFLSFQWDNLLLECGLLAAFLPSDRSAPLTHFLFRAVVFKLYFESGIAKWQSPLHDWHDGSAMTLYFETAPLPTWLAYHAHRLPTWWHHFESRATLVLELVIPLGIFGPRPARLVAAASFTLFQIVNAATANYGIFCYLALALHLFLLDDGDLERLRARLGPRVPAAVRRAWQRLERARAWLDRPHPAVWKPAAARWLARAGATAFVLVSFAEAMLHFAEPGVVVRLVNPVLEIDQRLRLVNTYHLFAAITRERIEPEFQTLAEGPLDDRTYEDARWTAQHLRHKPGDPTRAPNFVAPHQPRVDFQLWFYGLSFRRREPTYVSTLVERMCEDAPVVQPLFRAPLPAHPAAVRIVFWRYEFASRAERASGTWWRRARVAVSRAVPCPGLGSQIR